MIRAGSKEEAPSRLDVCPAAWALMKSVGAGNSPSPHRLRVLSTTVVLGQDLAYHSATRMTIRSNQIQGLLGKTYLPVGAPMLPSRFPRYLATTKAFLTVRSGVSRT